MYLDIHTHHRSEAHNNSPDSSTASIAIYNMNRGELLSAGWSINPRQNALPEYHYVSAGIHPWDIPVGSGHNNDPKTAGLQAQMERISLAAQHPQVLLIGECGLDKLKGGDLEMQQQTFLSQAQIATKHKKPLIIHCVRAFDELIALQKRHQFGVPMIIHGFNKSSDLATQLSRQGFILSFGAAIIKENSPAATTLIHQFQQHRPIFLETDNSHHTIGEIYKQAAILLEISQEALKDVIFASWKKIGLIHE